MFGLVLGLLSKVFMLVFLMQLGNIECLVFTFLHFCHSVDAKGILGVYSGCVGVVILLLFVWESFG